MVSWVCWLQPPPGAKTAAAALTASPGRAPPLTTTEKAGGCQNNGTAYWLSLTVTATSGKVLYGETQRPRYLPAVQKKPRLVEERIRQAPGMTAKAATESENWKLPKKCILYDLQIYMTLSPEAFHFEEDPGFGRLSGMMWKRK